MKSRARGRDRDPHSTTRRRFVDRARYGSASLASRGAISGILQKSSRDNEPEPPISHPPRLHLPVLDDWRVTPARDRAACDDAHEPAHSGCDIASHSGGTKAAVEESWMQVASLR